MNRRNKGKASATPARPSAATKSSPVPKPSATPAPATTAASARPSAPTPPPPPATRLTPSARLRQEWQNFEIWLAARRAERDNRLSEMRAAAKPARTATGLRGFLHVNPDKSPDLADAEYALNKDIAVQARAEWERRLEAENLKEDDWTDITPAEMAAVEDVFDPKRRSVNGTPLSGTSSLSGSTMTSSPNSTPPVTSSSLQTSPGGWTVHPSALPTIPPTSNGHTKQEQKPSTPLRTRTPSVSSPWSTRQDQVPTKPGAQDSLWDMMANGSNKSTNGKPAVSSPLASQEPEPEFENLYKLISPVIVEEEEGDFVEAGYLDSFLEESIRQFHAAAAEADIDLRRKLLALRAEHLRQKKKLIDSHHQAMQQKARDVVEGWKAARGGENERRRNEGQKPATVNGFSKRTPTTSAHPSSRIPEPVRSGGISAGKKPAVTLEDEPRVFPSESVEESIPSAPSWGWGSSAHQKSSAAKDNSGVWPRSTPTPVTGKPAPQTRNPFGTTPAATKKPTTSNHWATNSGSNGSQGRSMAVTVEDVDSDEEEDEEIIADFDNPEAAPAWNWTRNGNDNNSVPRGNTPNPEGRPRGMSNARSSPWADSSHGGYRGIGGDQKFETWRPGGGGSPPGREEGGIGGDMVDLATHVPDETQDVFAAMKMFTASRSTDRKRAGSTTKR